MVNFTTVACRISSRLKWYKNYKNRLRLSKVIVKNKMSLFYGSLCRVHYSCKKRKSSLFELELLESNTWNTSIASSCPKRYPKRLYQHVPAWPMAALLWPSPSGLRLTTLLYMDSKGRSVWVGTRTIALDCQRTDGTDIKDIVRRKTDDRTKVLASTGRRKTRNGTSNYWAETVLVGREERSQKNSVESWFMLVMLLLL